MSVDPLKVRPMPNWCIVLEDRPKEFLGAGVIASTLDLKDEKLSQGTGTIIRLGYSKKVQTIGLEEGQRVVFRGYLKFANPMETEELWNEMSTGFRPRKKYFFMSCDDIIGLIPPGTDVGVFSSPASHSIPKGAFDAPEKGK